ncbi:MAG: hypothetical protein BWY31_00525 [Lentisphaerae bacterium ADurb.Bin242]|nr:MAG: hypothetical protein BWY31_00525 [Lentisphaerae bacterium ADurb.Bin242]
MLTEREMLNALREKLETEEIFREIRILDNEIGYTALFEALPDLTNFPAAIIATGEVMMENGGYTSRTSIDVIVIDTYYGNDAKTEESQNVLKKTTEALNCNGFAKPLCINKVHYIFERITKLFLGDEYLVWNIRLVAKAINL